MQKAYLKTIVGILEICGDESGICEINFVDKFLPSSPKNENLKLCLSELEEYFEGKLKKFKTKLNIQGSKFQRKVYENLLKIPYGTTITYANLAQNIGNNKACRAVGNANGKNKIPIIIPCHRVVSSGGLGGYSGGEGLKTKQILLDLERNNA